MAIQVIGMSSEKVFLLVEKDVQAAIESLVVETLPPPEGDVPTGADVA